MKRFISIIGVLMLVCIAYVVFSPPAESQLGKKQWLGAARMEADSLQVKTGSRFAGTATFNGAVILNSTVTSAGNLISTPTTVASAAGNITLPAGTMIGVTGTGSITRIAPSTAGRIVYLYHATTDTLTDGVNLRLAGNFNATAGDVLTLVYSITGAAADTFWTEVSRSAN